MDDAVLWDGPWEHRFVSANGARFHLAAAGAGPAVILVHGYPGYWWTWRSILPALADGGYRAIAVDVRGFGASDKPPLGYDLPTAVADLAALTRSLGEDRATFVGHGLGAWTVRHLGVFAPAVVAALALVSMPVPGRFGAYAAPLRGGPVHRYLRSLRMAARTDAGGSKRAEVERMLREGSGPDGAWLTPEVIDRHTAALELPFVEAATEESFARLDVSARRRKAMGERREMRVPVLLSHGARDPFVGLAEALRVTRHAVGRLRLELLPDIGHFVPEEAPAELAHALVDWLPVAGGPTGG